MSEGSPEMPPFEHVARIDAGMLEPGKLSCVVFGPGEGEAILVLLEGQHGGLPSGLAGLLPRQANAAPIWGNVRKSLEHAARREAAGQTTSVAVRISLEGALRREDIGQITSAVVRISSRGPFSSRRDRAKTGRPPLIFGQEGTRETRFFTCCASRTWTLQKNGGLSGIRRIRLT